MRFAHVSDLHLGKRLGSYTLIEDQRHILSQIADIASAENCDGILIAGDIYDKSAPSAEAVKLFGEFLTKLRRNKLSVYIISGNHDSPERIDYGREIMADADIHICACYEGSPGVLTVTDEYGKLDICSVPFIKPSFVRGYCPNKEIKTYTDMMNAVIEQSGIDRNRRCIMMCHQFITGAITCDSEYISVGTLDNIGSEVFEGFDYVALGHIHSPQNIGKNIRYCGTPLKYSASEISHKKSVTIADIREKGDTVITTVPLVPMRDVMELRGEYNELMERSFYEKLDTDGFFFITLTDDTDIPNVMQKLRTVYHNIIQLSFDNRRTQTISEVTAAVHTDSKTPFELVAELFKEQNGAEMTEEQSVYIKDMIDKIWGGSL
ncbi:exonuclease SbcCD subunit D [Ruminococcus albus]|uniref:Nuclease SbcCD subunit D n=1 Tax=Ruminococcus albus TaxID=1264 RepID=A0A1H7NJR5_RUMAL|nr:exonuclease SbcCD subunit D [Ruminococcus albus]SEL23248.1 Exodeoxyribonuclease I subunit D [Ruminococcus albus]